MCQMPCASTLYEFHRNSNSIGIQMIFYSNWFSNKFLGNVRSRHRQIQIISPQLLNFQKQQVNTLHTYTNSAISLYIHDCSVHIFVYYSHIKNDKFYNKNSPYWLYIIINNYMSKNYLNIQTFLGNVPSNDRVI